ncbi:MAG: sporulation transcriptional regulator SpoIIID [Anaerovoracaceae bacterium]
MKNKGMASKVSVRIEARILEESKYMVEMQSTIRAVADKFGVAKTTVSKDFQKLKFINFNLYMEVREILEQNKRERSVRGGESTRKLYSKKRREKNNSISS